MKTDTQFFIISLSILLRIKHVSDKIVDKLNTHIFRSINFFSSKIVPCVG